jgi:MYXO-CTERM domain-containing protein
VISYDGRTLLAGWNDFNSQVRFEMARVTTDLVSLDPGGIGIPSVPLAPNACFASLASLPNGRSLLVSPPPLADGYWSSQVRARLITSVANQPLGSSCWGGDECASGTCEDGVCCDRTCGGSDPSDCQACSIAAGASSDGVCGVIGRGHVCRDVGASCDVPEICDGVSPLCPADAFKPADALCRRAAGPCDVSESCDGASARCPVDRVAGSGTVCRPARGPCDYEDQCDGHDSACPDQHRSDICRPGTGPCDPPESCTAESDDCPPDLLMPAGTPCGEPASGPCEASATCTGSDGQCPPKEAFPDGRACDDEDACTTDDVCSERQCAGQPVVCPEKQCQQGSCDRSTDGGCSYQPANDYTPCGDGGLCYHGTCGLPDSGFGDQPTLLDAGSDSGLDVGIEDAGGGLSDAGAHDRDGSTADASETGCGCSTSSESPWASWLMLVALLPWIRRARRSAEKLE